MVFLSSPLRFDRAVPLLIVAPFVIMSWMSLDDTHSSSVTAFTPTATQQQMLCRRPNDNNYYQLLDMATSNTDGSNTGDDGDDDDSTEQPNVKSFSLDTAYATINQQKLEEEEEQLRKQNYMQDILGKKMMELTKEEVVLAALKSAVTTYNEAEETEERVLSVEPVGVGAVQATTGAVEENPDEEEASTATIEAMKVVAAVEDYLQDASSSSNDVAVSISNSSSSSASNVPSSSSSSVSSGTQSSSASSSETTVTASSLAAAAATTKATVTPNDTSTLTSSKSRSSPSTTTITTTKWTEVLEEVVDVGSMFVGAVANGVAKGVRNTPEIAESTTDLVPSSVTDKATQLTKVATNFFTSAADVIQQLSAASTSVAANTRNPKERIDVTIPYDAASKIAYEAWKQQYFYPKMDNTNNNNSGDNKIVLGTYEIFRENYKLVTIRNVQIKKLQREQQQQTSDIASSSAASKKILKFFDLNEYADTLSVEEYAKVLDQSETEKVLGNALKFASNIFGGSSPFAAVMGTKPSAQYSGASLAPATQFVKKAATPKAATTKSKTKTNRVRGGNGNDDTNKNLPTSNTPPVSFFDTILKPTKTVKKQSNTTNPKAAVNTTRNEKKKVFRPFVRTPRKKNTKDVTNKKAKTKTKEPTRKSFSLSLFGGGSGGSTSDDRRSTTSLGVTAAKKAGTPTLGNTRNTKKTSSSPPNGIPVLSKWKQNRDGSLTGLISNSQAFKPGQKITTSPIAGKKPTPGATVTTGSGSKYYLA